jgi:hypothetical protein
MLMTMSRPGHTAIGLGVVLLGIPVYHLVLTRKRAHATAWNNPGLEGSGSIPPKTEND